MADTDAIRFVEGILRRADNQTRAILATEPGDAEVDSINVIIGDGAATIIEGIAAALRVDFACRITAAYLQEFDDETGSITVTVSRAQGGTAPTWVTLGSLALSGGRYAADESLSTWTDTYLERGDYLRFGATGSTLPRVHFTLRIRRLEP